jgi:hypothetical protein
VAPACQKGVAQKHEPTREVAVNENNPSASMMKIFARMREAGFNLVRICLGAFAFG